MIHKTINEMETHLKEKCNMLFGTPTLIETDTLEQCAALCRELNLDFVELNMNLPQYQPDRIDVPHFQAVAAQYGIFYTIHLDENLNVSDFNPYIADGYRRTVTETIALAKALRVPVLNMHLSRGVYFTLPEKKEYLFSKYRQQYLQSMVEFQEQCEKAVGDADIKICVENCSGFPEFQKEALELLLASPVFGLTFDIGHNHGSGGIDEPYIIQNKTRLCHMHMHDALGKKNHLAFGTGELNLAEYLTLAKAQSCRVVLETKTVAGLRQSVTWARQKGWL